MSDLSSNSVGAQAPGDCPFCGSHDTVLITKDHPCLYIVCRRCFARGPYVLGDEIGAIHSWNMRPVETDGQQDMEQIRHLERRIRELTEQLNCLKIDRASEEPKAQFDPESVAAEAERFLAEHSDVEDSGFQFRRAVRLIRDMLSCARGAEETLAPSCIWRSGCQHPETCKSAGCCVPGGRNYYPETTAPPVVVEGLERLSEPEDSTPVEVLPDGSVRPLKASAPQSIEVRAFGTSIDPEKASDVPDYDPWPSDCPHGYWKAHCAVCRSENGRGE